MAVMKGDVPKGLGSFQGPQFLEHDPFHFLYFSIYTFSQWYFSESANNDGPNSFQNSF